MIVKVCGINRIKNMIQVSELPVDMIGINFYMGSKRYIGNTSIMINANVKRVGIFVEPSFDEVKQYTDECQLDYVQLHGYVEMDFIQSIRSFVKVIKAFGVDEAFDFSATDAYMDCEMFLFDTASDSHGGTGKKFSWTKIDQYKGQVPFLLAGGIGPDDIDSILSIQHPQFAGVDINSQFEMEPGLKNVERVRTFANRLKGII